MNDLPSSAPKPAILLVEDEPALRDLVYIILEDLGAEVTAVATADEGLEALPKQPWALVITDVRTPGRSNGVQLALVAHDRLPSAGIIVMSGYYDQLGMPLPSGIRFLAKPWAIDDFLELVTTTLAHASR